VSLPFPASRDWQHSLASTHICLLSLRFWAKSFPRWSPLLPRWFAHKDLVIILGSATESRMISSWGQLINKFNSTCKLNSPLSCKVTCL
jgi:hypothetical protein